jgi:hypothetical protein
VAVTQTKVKYVIGCFVALSLTNLDQFYNLTVRCIVNTALTNASYRSSSFSLLIFSYIPTWSMLNVKWCMLKLKLKEHSRHWHKPYQNWASNSVVVKGQVIHTYI